MKPETPKDDIVISAVGAVSAVGATAAQTFTSVRADVRRMRECPELYLCLPDGPSGEPCPLVASPIYHLDDTPLPERQRLEWMARVAGQALRDLFRQARLAPAALRETGLFCGLPGQRPGGTPLAEPELAYGLHNAARTDLLGSLRFVAAERTGALALCASACEALTAGDLRYAVVGAVDSLLFRERLEPLDRDHRLLSDRAVDGFRPGEGAAFFLLERREEATHRRARPLAVLRGSTVARWAGASIASAAAKPVDGLPGTEKVPRPRNTGTALTEVIAPLIADGPEPFFLGDLNGESARTREWAFAVARLGKALRPPVSLEIPLATLGELGAATGAMLVTLAVQFFEKKYTAKRRAIVFCAADDGERRALLLEKA